MPTAATKAIGLTALAILFLGACVRDDSPGQQRGLKLGQPPAERCLSDDLTIGPTDATGGGGAILDDRRVGSFVDQLDVFDKPRKKRDELPAEDCGLQLVWYTGFGSNVPASAKPIVEKSRLLLGNLGKQRFRLFAWPLDSEDVCYTLVPDGLLHCSDRFNQSFLDPDGTGPYPDVVYGTIPIGVTALYVRDSGRWRRAISGRNGFFYESATWTFEEHALRVRFSDGSVEEVG
ncbi:MAG: hypothetical protein KY391_07200 [Actinobacteria bacterium]|nr:hypothetical protein [Actinomycetota bacterium]